MTMLRIALSGALCLSPLVAAPAWATMQAASANADDVAARRQVADQLMQVMFSKEAFPAFQPDFEANMAEAFKANPQLALMERIYPGATGRMLKSLVPQLRTIISASLPELHRQGAEHYASRLTVKELKRYYQFVSSPAGIAFRNGLAKNVDLAKAAKSMDRKGSISPEVREALQEDSAVTTASKLSDADLKQLIDFVDDPASKNLTQVDDEFMKIHAAWSQKLKTDNEAALREAATKAINPKAGS